MRHEMYQRKPNIKVNRSYGEKWVSHANMTSEQRHSYNVNSNKFHYKSLPNAQLILFITIQRLSKFQNCLSPELGNDTNLTRHDASMAPDQTRPNSINLSGLANQIGTVFGCDSHIRLSSRVNNPCCTESACKDTYSHDGVCTSITEPMLDVKVFLELCGVDLAYLGEG